MDSLYGWTKSSLRIRSLETKGTQSNNRIVRERGINMTGGWKCWQKLNGLMKLFLLSLPIYETDLLDRFS